MSVDLRSDREAAACAEKMQRSNAKGREYFTPISVVARLRFAVACTTQTDHRMTNTRARDTTKSSHGTLTTRVIRRSSNIICAHCTTHRTQRRS